MEYYTYSVAAIPGLDQFLIMGVHKDGSGFGILIDKNGNELSRNNNLPPIVRESQPALRTINGNLFITQAKADGGIMVLKLTANIELVKK